MLQDVCAISIGNLVQLMTCSFVSPPTAVHPEPLAFRFLHPAGEDEGVGKRPFLALSKGLVLLDSSFVKLPALRGSIQLGGGLFHK